MGLKKLVRKIGNNHLLMMIICCGAPLILLVIAVYFFGLSNSWLYWAILLLCPILHYFLMRDMCKDKKRRDGEKTSNQKLNYNKKSKK